LAAVHKQKLVHRDIKPSNIMVSLEEEGAATAKIIDLGLARAVSEPDALAAISTPGAFAGTPEFASPEQFEGVQFDIRSGLYSLAVTLWEMVTGKALFRGTSGDVMYQYQHQHAPFFLAVLCGCNAGLFREALHEILRSAESFGIWALKLLEFGIGSPFRSRAGNFR
jgi:serine/threonine protein kinase